MRHATGLFAALSVVMSIGLGTVGLFASAIEPSPIDITTDNAANRPVA